MTLLCDIMDSHGSDKSPMHFTGRHNYTEFYHKLLEAKRGDVHNVFEVGLGTNNTKMPSNMGKRGIPGASLRGWREYFSNANIYGADVDKGILFTEERIQTFYVDQLDAKTVQELWNNPTLSGLKFDFMVDDGLHTLEANINFLNHSIHMLAQDGLYVIEDVRLKRIPDYVRELEILSKANGFNYSVHDIHIKGNKTDNCLVTLKFNS